MARLWDVGLVFGKEYVSRTNYQWSDNPVERTNQMLERLLDIDPTSYDPAVPKPETSNEHYLAWLLDEGVCQALISFLLRPNEKKPPGYPKFKERPLGEEKPVKRSYHLMKLFLSWDKYFSSFVKKKLTEISTELFKILEPDSVGNLYHFHKIVEVLLRVCDYPFMDIVVSNSIIFRLFDCMHESPIADCTVRILACKFAGIEYRRAFYQALEVQDIFPVLGQKVYGKDAGEGSTFAVHFLGKLFDELAPLEGTEYLFEQICKKPDFVDGLLTVLKDTSGTYSTQQQTDCAHALRLLAYQSGEKFFETKPAPNEKEFVTSELPNMLTVIRSRLLLTLRPQIEPIYFVLENLIKRTAPAALTTSTSSSAFASAFAGSAGSASAAAATQTSNAIKFSSYKVPQPFTFFRLVLVELLTEIIIYDPAQGLDLLPDRAWSHFVPWFFQYSHNNIFQCLFFKLVFAAVKFNHVKTLDMVLDKQQLVPKLIESYKDLSAGNRGFIILLLNVLRLGSDSRPTETDYLHNHLKKLRVWNDFLPQLRTETLQQIKQLAPLRQEPKNKCFAGPLPPLKEWQHIDANSIDIGSQYASFLGFAPPRNLQKEAEQAAATAVAAAAAKENNNQSNSAMAKPFVRQGTVTDANIGVGKKGLPKLDMSAPGATPPKTEVMTKKGLPKLDLAPSSASSSSANSSASATPSTGQTPRGDREKNGTSKETSPVGTPTAAAVQTTNTTPAAAAAPQPTTSPAGSQVKKKPSKVPGIDLAAAGPIKVAPGNPGVQPAPANAVPMSPRGTSKSKLKDMPLDLTAANAIPAADHQGPSSDDARGGATPRPAFSPDSPEEGRAATPRPFLNSLDSPSGEKGTPRPAWIPKLQLDG